MLTQERKPKAVENQENKNIITNNNQQYEGEPSENGTTSQTTHGQPWVCSSSLPCGGSSTSEIGGVRTNEMK